MFEYKAIKYVLNIDYEVDELVEARDIVEAIYEQTEVFLKRALGGDLNTMHGKYIDEVGVSEINHNEGKTVGTAFISVYDGKESRNITLTIAAAVPEIVMVGPVMCSFTVKGIDTKPIKDTLDAVKDKIAKDFCI